MPLPFAKAAAVRWAWRRRRRATATRRRPLRRHLYLVLDDWSSGYTIREIDLLLEPGEYYASEGFIIGGYLGKQRLPPPVMRVEAARGSPTRVVVASGTSKLMFLQPPPLDGGDPSAKPTPPISMNNFVPVADVRSRSTSFGPRPADDPVDPVIYVPAPVAGGDGDRRRLFALDSRGAFSVLCPPSPLDDDRQEERWSWRALPDPPFERRHVVSYAARPDGGLVVSTKATNGDGDGDSEASFAFTMAGAAEGKPAEWNQHHMFMPFAGRGYFAPVLDGFVGLAGDPGSAGHLCLVYADGSQKLSKEKLFGDEDSAVERQQWPNTPVERPVGSTLVYLGGRGYFCLVQSLCHDHGDVSDEEDIDDDLDVSDEEDIDDDQDVSDEGIEDETTDDDDDQDVSRHSCRLFRLTAFCLKYDKNGDLRIAIQRVQYFDVPKGVTQLALKDPAAFWM